MKPKNIIIAIIFAVVGLFILQNFVKTESTTLIAFALITAFSLKGLGLSEYFFGDKHRKFTIGEIFIELLIVLVAVYFLTKIFPQYIGDNMFIKQAFAGMQ